MRAALATTVIVISAFVLPAQTTRHPLDALSAAEITRAVTVLRDAGRVSPGTRFGTITVQPLNKTSPDPRSARVLGFDWSKNEAFVAVVNLEAQRLTSWVVVDSEPPMRLLTIRRAEEAAHADPQWVEAMRQRNIDTARVSVLVGLPERAKLPRSGSDRVAGAFMWVRDAVPPDLTLDIPLRVNLTSGRLEGFVAGQAPAPVKQQAAPTRAPLQPLRIDQPSGSSVRIDGNVITWDHWKLRVGVDPRRGLEVHDVSFADEGKQRPVLYSGSITEIVAPYGDSLFSTWYPRDEGDYGMGIYSQSSAVELNDVPANAAFLPATMHDHLGRPVAVPRAIAVYERDGGM
jgi:primary-amine oxidase